MRNGNKSNVVGELGLAVGVLFVAACVGVGSTSPCGYFPFWEIIGATGALLSLRRSKVAKVIGLGVAFLIIALYLWGLRDYLHLLGEGRFQEFFGW